MKKIMISLLMMAATLNAMAITYTGKVQVVLRATSNNAACAAIVATSNALNDGLNPLYYAELNDEGKEVLVYVEYNSVRYEHFGTSAKTMRNMPLIMKANASGEYRMNFYEMEGTIEIYDKVAGANIDKSQPYIFTIEDAQKNTIIANRFVINYAPGYDVELNADGLATFSADEAVAIPSGLRAFKAEYVAMDEELSLSEIFDNIPANTGVFLYGAPSAPFTLLITSAVPALSDNDLKPASAWASREGTIYVLSGSMMYLYEEANMKDNKAYLELPASAPAPKRIRLSFGEATSINNVEAEAVKAVKFVENGQIYVRRGNEVYNLQGQIVK